MEPNLHNLRSISRIKPGDDGIDETIAAMCAVAEHASNSPAVAQVARNIYDNAGTLDPLAALYDFMVRRVRFKEDPYDREFVQHPEDMLAQMAANSDGMARGDCDDLATLAVSIMKVWQRAGHAWVSPAFVVVAKTPDGPFVHVLYANIEGLDVNSFDPQERVPPGRLSPLTKRVKVYAA